MTKTITPPHPDHDKTADQSSTQFKEDVGIEENPDYKDWEEWEELEKELKEGKYDLSVMLMN